MSHLAHIDRVSPAEQLDDDISFTEHRPLPTLPVSSTHSSHQRMSTQQYTDKMDPIPAEHQAVVWLERQNSSGDDTEFDPSWTYPISHSGKGKGVAQPLTIPQPRDNEVFDMSYGSGPSSPLAGPSSPSTSRSYQLSLADTEDVALDDRARIYRELMQELSALDKGKGVDRNVEAEDDSTDPEEVVRIPSPTPSD